MPRANALFTSLMAWGFDDKPFKIQCVATSDEIFKEMDHELLALRKAREAQVRQTLCVGRRCVTLSTYTMSVLGPNKMRLGHRV